MSFGTTELLIVLAILVVVFGSKRIRTLGSDLGTAIKGFRRSLGDDSKSSTDDEDNKPEDPPKV